METILIATNFPEASRNASFYGVKLAKLLGDKVVLLYVYSFMAPSADPVAITTNNAMLYHSREGLRTEVGWLDLKGTVDIEKHSVQVDPVEVILSEANKVNATCIFAGMKGAGRIERKIFGGQLFH